MYIGDAVFEELCKIPDFETKAREMITHDWRKGTTLFRDYVSPLAAEIFVSGAVESGPLDGAYLERRLMSPIAHPEREPWLWAFLNLAGAHMNRDQIRTALNGIEKGSS